MDIKSIKRKVVDQLVEGYEFATQLQLLLSKPFGDHRALHDPTRMVPGLDSGSGSADELMEKILGSFDKTISVLGSFEQVAVAVPVEGSRDTSCGDYPAAVSDGRYEDSGDSRKRLGVNNNKGKRGCYKRKRKLQTWTVESNTIEDLHAWRKYGQKEILNAKYPRSYFRCTHKYTQGCNAIKQVQKLEHDPGMFQITYIGDHTCNPNEEILTKIEPSEIIVDSHNTFILSHSDNKVITCSDTDQSKAKQEENSSVTVTGTVKEEDTNGDEYQDCPATTTGDLSLVWQDFMAFEEHGLMYCCGETSSYDMDMDLMMFGNRDFAFGNNNQQLSFSDVDIAYRCNQN